MKFTDYLEAIRDDIVYQELSISSLGVSQPKVKVEMTQLSKEDVENIEDAFLYIIATYGNKKIYSTFEEYSRDSRDNVEKKINEFYKEDQKKRDAALSILDSLEKIKGNAYYYLGFDSKYVFTAGPKLYFVKLNDGLVIHNKKQKQLVTISFDEITDDYPNGNYTVGNSLFNKKLYGSAGSDLFKKIAGIVRKEFENWNKIVFHFEAKKEDSESDNEDAIISFVELLRRAIDDHLAARNTSPEIIGKVKTLKSRAKNIISTLMKKTIKEKYDNGSILKEAGYISKDPQEKENIAKRAFDEANSFIDDLLSGKTIQKLNEKLLIPSSIFRVEDSEVKNSVSGGSMRQKLYLNIIGQMFGKVYTFQKNGDLFFSKSKTLEKTNAII